MPKPLTETWRSLLVVAVVLPVAAIIAIVVFVSIRSTPLHPNPLDVPSVLHSAPLPKWADAVDKGRQIVRKGLTGQNLPGVSVAVGVGHDIVWAEGIGWANLEQRVPVAPDMQFRIGHVSKALTSAAVGLLVEQGRLNLDDEIQTLVPAFPQKPWPMTLRQLMGNMAGVRHYRDTEWGDKPSTHCERASEGLKSFANDPLLFEPGTQYKYSTYGWVLVSAAVEAAAEPFFTFMRAQIFTPLGMTRTTYDSTSEPVPDRATFYQRDFLGRERPTAVDYSCFAGAGAFLSTPSDLVRFGLAVNNGKLVQPATVAVLQTPQRFPSGKETEYGLGWMLERVTLAGEPARMAGHASRMLTGGSTSFLTFPERGLVVAVTTNISFADTKWIAWSVAQIFAEQAKRPPRE